MVIKMHGGMDMKKWKCALAALVLGHSRIRPRRPWSVQLHRIRLPDRPRRRLRKEAARQRKITVQGQAQRQQGTPLLEQA